MAVEDALHRRPAPGTTLLEREAEREAVGRLLAQARDGAGGLMLLEGIAGSGKSALLNDAVSVACGVEMSVRRATGYELEKSFPWGVARMLLERDGLLQFTAGIRDEAGQLADRWFEIANALYHLVLQITETAPVLLVVDDAHWSDAPSLRFLLYLAHRLAEQPVALLLAARTGEQGEDGLLDFIAADPLASVRRLDALSEDAVTTLVRERHPRATAAFCRRCFQLTAGNPLQVRELLTATAAAQEADEHALDEAAELAARSLARCVVLRLERLSPSAQMLARSVAVLEGEADPGLAAAVARLKTEDALMAVDQLEAADLLHADGTLSFVHPLLRSAVYEKMRFSERATKHQQAAELLAERGAPPERIATHLLECLPAGAASTVGVLRAAARRALEQGAPGSAARYLERALREPPSPEERVAILVELGRAEALAGRPQAPARLEAAIESLTDERDRAVLLLDLGRALAQWMRFEESSVAFKTGLAAVRDDRSELALDLKSGYLTSTMHIPDMAGEVRRQVGEIMTSHVALTTRAQRGLASKAMIVRLFAGESFPGTLKLARDIFGEGRLIQEDRFDSQVLTHVVSTLGWCDDYSTAEQAFEMTLAEAARSGSALAFAMASQLRARQRLWTGRADDALADARAATDVFKGGGLMYRYSATYVFIWALLEHNEVDEADEVMAVSDRAGSGTGRSAWREAARGILAARHGDDSAALEAFLACGRRLNRLLVNNPVVLPWRSEAGLAAYRLGQHEQARTLISEELKLAERFGAARALAVAKRAAGVIDRDHGIERLASAADALQSSGADLERARTLVDLGAAIRRSGQRRKAREVLHEAIRLAQLNASPAVADRARAELHLAGGRDRQNPLGRTANLTPSERRAAELAAAGRTNRQIADELFVTVKAVEWHLGNVYRKLAIRGRGDLADALSEPGKA